MINKKNKRLEITLTQDEWELLNSLSIRFNINKSAVIKQALKVFASKRKHYLTISYKEIDIYQDGHSKGSTIRAKEDTISDEEVGHEWNKLIDSIEDYEAKTGHKIEIKDDNDLPF